MVAPWAESCFKNPMVYYFHLSVLDSPHRNIRPRPSFPDVSLPSGERCEQICYNGQSVRATRSKKSQLNVENELGPFQVKKNPVIFQKPKVKVASSSCSREVLYIYIVPLPSPPDSQLFWQPFSGSQQGIMGPSHAVHDWVCQRRMYVCMAREAKGLCSLYSEGWHGRGWE